MLPCPQDREVKTTEANEGGGEILCTRDGGRKVGVGYLRKRFIWIRSSQPGVSADSQRAWKTDKSYFLLLFLNNHNPVFCFHLIFFLFHLTTASRPGWNNKLKNPKERTVSEIKHSVCMSLGHGSESMWRKWDLGWWDVRSYQSTSLMNITMILSFFFVLSHDRSVISHLYRTASTKEATVHQQESISSSKQMNIYDSQQELLSF